jgi:hypothetical protein
MHGLQNHAMLISVQHTQHFADHIGRTMEEIKTRNLSLFRVTRWLLLLLRFIADARNADGIKQIAENLLIDAAQVGHVS